MPFKTWLGTTLALLLYAGVCVIGASGLIAQQQAPNATSETPEQFPDFPGRDDTYVFCTGCHGFKLVAAQGMSRNKWDETLVWMTEKHSMADIQGEPREAILDYLATAFPAKQTGGFKQPFAN